jgi:hypothetical protein
MRIKYASRDDIYLKMRHDILCEARNASPKSDDVCFKKVPNKIYFKVPVIPPRRFAEVKGSP